MPHPGVSYPPIERLAPIGDRRTAALVGADGTIGWWCLPNFDGEPIFGNLLAAEDGGSLYAGPAVRQFGRQRYEPDSFVLRTRWDGPDGILEATAAMPWPQDERDGPDDARRVILTRLRSLGGYPRYRIRIDPRMAFGSKVGLERCPGGAVWRGGDISVGLWSSIPLDLEQATMVAEGSLPSGAEIWLAIGPDEHSRPWSAAAAAKALIETLAYWRGIGAEITSERARLEPVRRAGLLTELLTFAPTGAVVASPSAGLPERIGGGRNFDYRYSWVRDTSLALALAAEIGRTKRPVRHLDWLTARSSESEMPLQVLYHISGEARTEPVSKPELPGYRGSQPVRFGNPADKLFELDTFGYLADSALIALEQGGTLRDGDWALLARNADFVAATWHRPGASIWEITPEHHFVVSKVMSWVTLDRTLKIAERAGHQGQEAWSNAQRQIHAEVCDKGYSQNCGTFRQRYDSEAIDAALLLIPLMGFLPPEDARVVRTIERIERELSINGHIHRFVAAQVPHQGTAPLGEEEGSFLLCTCWLAQVWARLGLVEKAEAALAKVTAAMSETGLLSEGVDARSGALLGNMPLLFSHVEYARAVLAIHDARQQGHASAHPEKRQKGDQEP